MEVDSAWHVHEMHQLLYAFEGSVEVESSTDCAIACYI
jgi:hypothetical protein